MPEKAQPRPTKPKLPSNWDRYEEEETDSGLAGGSGEVQVSDVPAPRSKGADYRYLIAEAQSQSQSVPDEPCVDGFVSLGDVLPGKVPGLVLCFSAICSFLHLIKLCVNSESKVDLDCYLLPASGPSTKFDVNWRCLLAVGRSWYYFVGRRGGVRKV